MDVAFLLKCSRKSVSGESEPKAAVAKVLEQGKRGLEEHRVLSQVPGSEVGERRYRVSIS